MKPKPLLTVLLALAISGGLLWAFPVLWMGLILVLLALLAGQATLIRRSLTVVRADHSAPALSVSRAAASPGIAPAFTNQSGTSAKPALDPAAFARFRAHLETVEKERGLGPGATTPSAGGPPAPAAQSAPAPGTAAASLPGGGTGGDSTAASAISDRVVLSSTPGAAKQPVPATPKVKSATTYGPQRGAVLPGGKRQGAPKTAAAPVPAASAQADETEGPDLFADLRPTPLPARPTPAPTPPDELGARLKDIPDGEPPSDEAAALLKLAEEAMRRGDVNAARAGLDQHLELMPAGRASWGARRLEVRVAALSHEPERALDAFEAMLAAGFPLKAEGVPALMGDLLDGVKADLADSLRVSLLLKTLAAFRQAANRPAMDAVYRLLIEAQERVGDERKLVQFLKNHLEIKKVMGETAGQVDLIDQIGNRLFKLGETAEAREYYELGLKIRADLQQAELTRTSTKSGTTPQTA